MRIRGVEDTHDPFRGTVELAIIDDRGTRHVVYSGKDFQTAQRLQQYWRGQLEEEQRRMKQEDPTKPGWADL